MKFFGITRRIVAITFAAAFAICSGGALKVYAAGGVDTSATISIKAQVGKNDESLFAQNYAGEVKIGLYKIADLDSAGNASLTDAYREAGIDLSVLQSSPTVADIERMIVEPAISSAYGKQADAVITATRKESGFSGTVSIPKGAGIYLYIPQSVSDEKYQYKFTSYIIFAPSSDYIASGMAAGDDTWKYDVSFILKPQETPVDTPKEPTPTPTPVPTPTPEITIPDEPTPTHGDIVEFGEDVIELGSKVPLFGAPKTGDTVLPLIFCGIALLLGLAFVAWYFKNEKQNHKTV